MQKRFGVDGSFWTLCELKFLNTPFLCCLLPLFQNKSSFKTFHIMPRPHWPGYRFENASVWTGPKNNLDLHENKRASMTAVWLIFIWMVWHEDSFWQRGKKQFGMAYSAQQTPQELCIPFSRAKLEVWIFGLRRATNLHFVLLFLVVGWNRSTPSKGIFFDKWKLTATRIVKI